MTLPANEVARSRDLIRRINEAAVKSGAFEFPVDGAHVWSFFQQRLWADLRAWRKDPAGWLAETPFRIKDALVFAFLVAVSLAAMTLARLREASVVVFGTDIATPSSPDDPRLAGVYSFLRDDAIRFVQVLHTVPGAKVLQNLRRRGRAVVYLEAFRALALLGLAFRVFPRPFSARAADGDLPGFSEEEKPFARTSLRRYAREANISLAVVRLQARFLRSLAPRAVLLMDDTRYWNELLVAAKRAGVRTIAVQHGRIGLSIVGVVAEGIPAERCPVPDLYVAWNDYWKEKLSASSPAFARVASSIVAGGRPNPGVAARKSVRADDGVTTVLYIHEPASDPADVRAALEALLACRDVAVVYKLRKDEAAEKQLAALGLEGFVKRPGFRAVADLDEALLAQVDVVAGSYSTMLYELVEAERPVAVFEMRSTEAGDLVADGMAVSLRAGESGFEERLKSAASVSAEELSRRARRFAVDADLASTLRRALAEGGA